MPCQAKQPNESWYDYCWDNPGCSGCTADGSVDWSDLPNIDPSGTTGPGPAERDFLIELGTDFRRTGDVELGLRYAERLRALNLAEEAIAVYRRSIASIEVNGPEEADLLARVHQGQGRALDMLGQVSAANQAFAQAQQLGRIAGLLTNQRGTQRIR